MSSRVVTVRVRVTIECTECAQPVPVNGMVPSVLCHACQAVIPLERQLSWKNVLSYAKAEAIRKASGGIVLDQKPIPVLEHFLATPHALRRHFQGILLELDPNKLVCAGCRTVLDARPLADLAATGASEAHCTGCGAAVPLRAATDEHQRAIGVQCARLLALVGETAPRGDLSEKAAGGDLVLFACLGCGASLKVDASAPRMLTCEFCQATSYIPDALWLRMHPAARKRPFYFVLEQTATAHF